MSQAFVDALRAAGHRVIVLAYLRSGDAPPEHPDDRIAGVRPIETREAGLGHLAAWWLTALATCLPYSSAKYRSRGYRRLAARELAADPGLVVIDHAQMGWMARATGGRRGVYLAHNVEHELYASQARGGIAKRLVYRREARLVRRLERKLSEWACQVWALSDADAVALAKLGGGAGVRAFGPPGGVRPAGGEPDADVVLLGRWTWQANAEGLLWFLDEVAPRLPPDLTVRIGGAGAPSLPPGAVRIDGEVADAGAYLARGRVIAIPAQAGAGVQVKTLDAIATGRPVVATPLATRGLGDLPATVRVESDPQAFADALVEGARAPLSALVAVAAAGDWMAARVRTFEDAVARAVDDAH